VGTVEKDQGKKRGKKVQGVFIAIDESYRGERMVKETKPGGKARKKKFSMGAGNPIDSRDGKLHCGGAGLHPSAWMEKEEVA